MSKYLYVEVTNLLALANVSKVKKEYYTNLATSIPTLQLDTIGIQVVDGNVIKDLYKIDDEVQANIVIQRAQSFGEHIELLTEAQAINKKAQLETLKSNIRTAQKQSTNQKEIIDITIQIAELNDKILTATGSLKTAYQTAVIDLEAYKLTLI